MFIYSFLVLDFLWASICMFHVCWFCNCFWTHVVHRWLFLGKAAPVALAVCLFRPLTKMYRDLFLLKIDSNWAVSLHASKTFPSQQLAQNLPLGFSQGCGLDASSLVWGFPALLLMFYILWACVLDTDLRFGCCSTNDHLSAPLLNLHEKAGFKKPTNALSL